MGGLAVAYEADVDAGDAAQCVSGFKHVGAVRFGVVEYVADSGHAMPEFAGESVEISGFRAAAVPASPVLLGWRVTGGLGVQHGASLGDPGGSTA